MITIFLRTLIIYTVLIGAMRLMGKRQIGELEVSELVTTLILSEIAALPIENPEIPVVFAVVPILTLLFIEVLSSQLLISFPRLKNLLTARPTVLIRNGKPDLAALKKTRVSFDELVMQLRQKEVGDLTEVNYAILEQNGNISVLRKKLYQPPDASTMRLKPQESGIMHILVSEGHLNRHNLQTLSIKEEFVMQELQKRNCTLRNTALLLMDDTDKIVLVRKNASSEGRNAP